MPLISPLMPVPLISSLHRDNILCNEHHCHETLQSTHKQTNKQINGLTRPNTGLISGNINPNWK